MELFPTDPAQSVRPLVYVGPNMGKDLPMQQYTAFSGGLPPAVRARCDQDPDFAALIVPVAELSAARAALGRPGSALSSAYRAVWAAYVAKPKEGK